MKKRPFKKTTVPILLLRCNNDVVGTMVNRKALINRNQSVIHRMDSLSSLSVENCNFSFTVDPTNLQTFPAFNANDVSLGTQSTWSWRHNYANPQYYTFSEPFHNYYFSGWNEPYTAQFKIKEHQQNAANRVRVNPHRLNLGIVCLTIRNPQEKKVAMKTGWHSQKDMIAASILSSLFHAGAIKIHFRFFYPTTQNPFISLIKPLEIKLISNLKYDST